MENLKTEEIRGSEVIEGIGKELYGEDFSITDPKLREIYQKVYSFFKEKKSKKGVLLVSDVGGGKTALMKVYQRLLKDTDRRFKWVNAYELKDLSENLTSAEIKDFYGYKLKCDLYIDDIGFGFDVKRYGNTVNIISEIIIERYDLFKSSGFKTHFSSNIPVLLKDDQSKIPTIQTLYGTRVLDRIKEMCNLITWKGASLRK